MDRKTKPASELHIETLEEAILDLHGCKARWVESVPVKELFEGEIVWDGVVEVFVLEDHITAKRCYAWSHKIDGSKKRKFFAILHEGPVKSAQDAVRVSIVNDFKSKKMPIN